MGITNTSWKSTWNHGKTCTIRIPEIFKDEVLEYARALDSDEPTSGKLALKLMNHYLNKESPDGRKRNRNVETSPRWYHWRKFREWLIDIRS